MGQNVACSVFLIFLSGCEAYSRADAEPSAANHAELQTVAFDRQLADAWQHAESPEGSADPRPGDQCDTASDMTADGPADAGSESGTSTNAGAHPADTDPANADPADADPEVCRQPFVERIDSCIVAFLEEAAAEPQLLDRVHAAQWCSDAEPVAAVWDRWCAAEPDDGWCVAEFFDFYDRIWPTCANSLRHAAHDRTCTFGPYWRTVEAQRGLFVTERFSVTSIAQLGAFEAFQLLEAVRASAHSDVVHPAEALARVDQDSMMRITLWDASNDRAWRAFEYAVGDNVYGRIFPLDSTYPVATIVDGDITNCTAMLGDTGRRCSEASPCRDSFACIGIVDEIQQGACMPAEATEREAGLCRPTAEACGGSESGAYCSAGPAVDEGVCQPLQNRARFESSHEIEVPAGTASELVLYASGLATVSTDLWLTLDIELRDRSGVSLYLSNPDGTRVDLLPHYVDRDLREAVQLDGFPGDELANGAWTLTVDATEADAGTLTTVWRWSLVIGSRFD